MPKRGLKRLAATTITLLAYAPPLFVQAADVEAVRGSIAIGGDVTESTITINDLSMIMAAMRQVLAEESGKEAAELRERLGVSEQVLTTFFTILAREEVPPEELPQTLAQIDQRHAELLRRLVALQTEDPENQALLEEAQTALDQGQYEQTDALLQRIEKRELAALRQAEELLQAAQEAVNRRKLSAAAAGAERGELSLTQLRYREAAEHFAAAVGLVPEGDPDERGWLLVRQADALQIYGDRKGDNEALHSAAAAYRAALEEFTRERRPLDWAQTQNDLGATLAMLGRLESSTATLEAAVAAFRAALEEFTRERHPLDWAQTQNDLGATLAMLGRLEEAVAAFRAALQERTRERVPLEWAHTQHNLGNLLAMLGEPEAAVAAYRAALEEQTREWMPLGWAHTQRNLGLALRTLGERNEDIATLNEAREAISNARQVYVVEARNTRYTTDIDELLSELDAIIGEMQEQAAH